jgi:signal transduction histidine kinase
MLNTELLLISLQPSAAQKRLTASIAVALFLAFLSVLPFRNVPLPAVTVFIPAFDAILVVGVWIAAILLFGQASVLNSRALMTLATGFFFTGLIIIPHLLSYPDALSLIGLPGARPNSSHWLYLCWHAGMPAAVIAYVILRDSEERVDRAKRAPLGKVSLAIGGAVCIAVALALIATLGEPLLPQLVKSRTAWHGQSGLLTRFPVVLLIAVATTMLWRARRSVLDLWLMIILWGWFLELVLMSLVSNRFTAGWYAWQALGVLSGLSALGLLLAQSGALYARAVLLLDVQSRERESRSMMGDAIGAAIAHQLRQPLTALVINAQVSRRLAAEGNPNLPSLLEQIVEDSFRANDIINSTRAVFGKTVARKNASSINKLVQDTVAMISPEIQAHMASIDFKLEKDLPSAFMNRLQIQQVLLNMFTNALEAMGEVADRSRVLTVHTSREDGGLVIKICDTGRGIDATHHERIFDAFFTTKENGTGLGLTVCRRVIEAHGGRVETVPGPGIGAMFRIFLPIGQVA